MILSYYSSPLNPIFKILIEVKVMVIVLSTTRVPISKVKEVGKRYLEVTKKFPTDKTLGKEILRLAGRITGDEIEVIGLTEVKEGKYDEYLERSTKIQLMYADIEGIKFKVDLFLSGVKAMPLVGFEMPE
jgi:hypothetical protein